MTRATSRRSFLKSSTVGASAAAATLVAPAVARAQQVTTWRCQSMWSAAELTYKTFQDLCERIKANTNGRLIIEPFAAGAVTGVFETLDAVGAGVLQAHSSWPGYFSGKDAGLAVISDFVFGYQHPHQAEAWFQHRGGLQMLREAYAKYNVYPIGVSWWGVESIVSKKPIQKLEDFKGVKFRSPQGMTAEILTKLGASIVVLPGGEVFSALDKGVVDAADWATISMNERMGFHGIAKYPTKVFHSMPVQEFSVNVAAWKALPDDIKVILHSTAREWTWDQV
ncbi:MAG: C4-dicarboxylate ABC transporter substrate-binding protein, partial [Hyphomicrobiaceae bacterium]